MDRRILKDRRRSGPTPSFPFQTNEGQWVFKDRRMVANRRLSDFELEMLWRKIQAR